MKILFYIEAEHGLGHFVRVRNIIKSLFNNNGDLKFVCVVNGFCDFSDMDVKVIDKTIELSSNYLGKWGMLDSNFDSIFIPIVENEKPDLIIFDTFYSLNVCRMFDCEKILILRKYYDEEVKEFFKLGYNNYFNKILIPHLEDEFVGIDVSSNCKFIGPIIQTECDISGIKKKYGIKEDECLVVGTVAGGGFSDASKFLNCCLDAFGSIDGIRFILQTGPFFHEKLKVVSNIEIVSYEENMVGLFDCANLVICQAGYNTMNELAYLGKHAVVLPSVKPNDDQVIRSKFFKKKFGFDVLTEFDSLKLKNLIIKKKDLNFVKKKNKFETGNDLVAKEIDEVIKKINPFSPKHIRLKVGSTCNNNCKYCKLLNIKSDYDKSCEEIKKELVDVRKKHINEIIFPCNSDMRKDFIDLIKFSRFLGFRVVIESNGRMFSYKGFVAQVKDYLNRVDIYLNGDEIIHDKLTKVEGFKDVVFGINNLTNRGIEVQVNTIIYNENFKRLKEIIVFVKKFGIKKWRLIYPVLNGMNNYIPKVIDSYLYIEEAVQYAIKSNIEIIYGGLFFNPFIPENLLLDYNQGKVMYEYKIEKQKIPSNINLIFSNKCNFKYLHCNLMNGHYDNNIKKISVIIPTYNRKDLLKLCLISLFNQDYFKDKYEIIVVDDGGSDDTFDMIKKLKPTCDLKYLYWPRNKPYIFGNSGNRVGPARNLGVKYVKGDVLLFWDSDMLADKNVLREHMKKHVSGSSAIGIRKFLKKNIREINKKELETPTKTAKMLEQIDYQLESHKYPWFFWVSNNVMIEKKEFDSLCGFSSDFPFWGDEDQELGYRLFKSGIKIKINKNAIGFHMHHKPESINDEIYLKNKLIHKNIFYKKHLDKEIFEFYKSFFIEPIKVIDWVMTDNCNYSCSYCNSHSCQESDVVDNLSKFKILPGVWYIVLSGGEPFMVKNINHIIKNIVENTPHKISIVTNLSANFEKIKSVLDISKERIGDIYASMHLEHVKFKDFFKKAQKVNNFLNLKGKKLNVVSVAVKGKLTELKKYGDQFLRKGINFELQPIKESYNNLDYYDSKEKYIIKNYGRIFGIYSTNFKGRICDAGNRYIFLDKNGIAFRCHDSKEILGQDSIELQKPKKCTSKRCSCHIPYQNSMIHSNYDTININITHKCNLKCKICFDKDHFAGTELTVNEFSELFINLRKIGAEKINFSGGEPTIKKDFLKILDLAIEQGLKVNINTNGTFSDQIANELSLRDFGHITFSLYSSDSLHDNITRVKGSLDKCIKNLKILIDKGKNVYIQAVVMKQNLNKIKELVDFSKKLGAKGFFVQAFNPFFGGSKGQKIIREHIGMDNWIDNLEQLDSLVEFLKKNGFVINSNNYLENLKKYFRNELSTGCMAGNTFGIDSNGRVMPCWGFDWNLGNIKDRSLSSILVNMKKIQKIMHKCKVPCLLNCYEKNRK